MILTLMILAVLSAMIIEFSYGVYTTSASLYNWRDSQKLSLAASSGVTLAVETISQNANFYPYTYPAKVDIPLVSMMNEFNGKVLIRVEDENSKFNINSIVEPNNLLNDRMYNSFILLIRHLNLEEDIADKVADWIDRDSEPRMAGSEKGARNGYMDSIDELLLIDGIDRKAFNRLSPYITVYALDSGVPGLININTASIPVIMSLDESITEEIAGRVVAYRDISPFKKTSDIVRVAGFEGALGQSLLGRIAVKASHFRITSTAEDNGIKRIIESVVELRGGKSLVRYWMEI